MTLISCSPAPKHPHTIWLCFATFLFAGTCTDLTAQERTVDFRYAPRSYFSAICLPDDWLKSVVTERGGLGYDFGPGPYAVPLTEIWLDLKETKIERQYLANPNVPIVTTEYTGNSLLLRLTTFAIAPVSAPYQPPNIADGRVQRFQGLNGTVRWASPKGIADSAFRNVAWGVNRPIKYRVTVPPFSRKLVALGVCEPYKWGPGLRILEFHVEGSPPLRVDPMASGEKNIPCLFLVHGADADGDGKLDIEADATTDSPDANVILNAFWIFPDNAAVTPAQVLRGDASGRAELYYGCGPEEELFGRNLRVDAILVEFNGTGAAPLLNVRSRREFAYNSTSGILSSEGQPFLLTRPTPLSCTRNDTHWSLEFARGTTQIEIIAVHGRPAPGAAIVFPDLHAARSEAIRYWESSARIPGVRILVPDSGIQYLLDANIRNLYQVREQVDGMLQFQPGPSVYRGLWIHDAVWHITAALMLGDTAGARAAIETLLRCQLPNGRVRVMAPWVMIPETPLFVYILCRYAEMTQDTTWLSAHWKSIVRGLEWVKRVRVTMMSDPKSRTYGLMPPSFADGGLAGVHVEYSSVYWTLIGLRKAVETARWLRRTSDAGQWQLLYAELLDSFFTASRRDMRRDKHGNLYLSLKVADTSRTTPPQQAQWALLEAQCLGHLFDPKDSLVNGTLAMLDAGSKEGLALNTGWLRDGLWPFFAGFHGMAHLWQGNISRAQDLLYAYANHASPLGTWVEEQLPQIVGTKTTGDGSNASAGALFIMLARNLIALERENSLDLLAGVPDHWFRPGGAIRLENVPTQFGNLSLTVIIHEDGRSGSISVSPIRGNGGNGRTRVHLRALKQSGFLLQDGTSLPEVFEATWGKPIRLSFKRSP